MYRLLRPPGRPARARTQNDELNQVHAAAGGAGVTSAIYVDVLRKVQRDAVDCLGHLFGPDGETDT